MDLLSVIDALWSVGEKIIGYYTQRGENGRSALRALSNALDETYLYYARTGRNGGRDRMAEELLAKHWSAAAVAVRDVDRNLALVLERKAQYWIDPDSWTEAEVKAAGIKLQTVRNRYRRLLAPKRVRLSGRALSKIAPGRKTKRAR